MKHEWRMVIACLFALLAFDRIARADMPTLSKEFEEYMLAHHYVAVGLEAGGTNEQWVRAKINGQSIVMEVDTGCNRTCLTYQCARNLGLDIHEMSDELCGTGGVIQGKHGIALINSLDMRFGAINRTNTLEILPKSANIQWGVDGYFGADFLRLNAAVFPLGGHGILLKPGPTPAVSISDYMTRLNFESVPLHEEGGQLWVEAHLNGKALKLLIDSGAGFTNIRAASVRAALNPNEIYSNQWLTLQGLDGKRQTSFYFTPKQFNLSGLDVSGQTLLATDSAGFNKDNYDGLLGVDLLGLHKAILDFGNGILWMK